MSKTLAKTKQVKVVCKLVDSKKFADAITVIEQTMQGPWKDAVEAWEAKGDGPKIAEQAPLFSRLLKIAERLR